MVLYKRKRVTYTKPPDLPVDLSMEVLYIPETKEWFKTYDEYLERMEYYQRRKFVCEITGNSCLTFLEALESEEREIKGVEKNFPEALREHILRFLQFNRITRLDQLVDKVYSVFKNDYFPGENVYIKGPIDTDENSLTDSQNTIKQRGTIREKVQYGLSDSLTTKYLVIRLSDMKQAIVTKDKISRDRNHFTKWLIKTFIKLTMSRSHKVGAPWVVKDKYAKKYRIPQTYPEDLKHFANSTPTGEILYEDSDLGSPSPAINDINKPPNKKRKMKHNSKASKGKSALNNIVSTEDLSSRNGILNKPDPDIPGNNENNLKSALHKKSSDRNKRFPLHHLPSKVQQELDQYELDSKISNGQTISNNSPLISIQPSKKHIVDDLHIRFDLQNPKPFPKELFIPSNSININKELIKDLKGNLKSLDKSDLSEAEITKHINSLSLHRLTSIQEALQVWTFLNIFHKALKLDTFTFDDFIYAMGWNLDQFSSIGRCHLLDEIWCAVLGAIVSNEIPINSKGDEAAHSDDIYGLLISLPSTASFLNDEDIHERSNNSLGNNDNEENKTKIKTKVEQDFLQDLNKEDSDGDNVDDDDEDSSREENINHNAYLAMNYRNIPWHDRLRRRNFKDGNWQCIVLGVLSLVEHVPAYKNVIDQTFPILAPVDFQPTPLTVLHHYYEKMDVNLRIKVLNILVELLMNGSIVRNYIDECLELSTHLRRERLDSIRDIKSSLEVAQKQNQAIFDLMNESSGKDNMPSNKRPRLNFKALEMTEEESHFFETNEPFKQAWNLRKESLQKIESYKIVKREIEKKLIELDCQRVKLLGKDRLFNRYWWFENNGLPTIHGKSNEDDDIDEDAERDKGNDSDVQDDADEVLDETYLMGKLWVQGPTDEDLRIHLKSSMKESHSFIDEFSSNKIDFMETVARNSESIVENDFYNNNESDKDKINAEKNIPERVNFLKFGDAFIKTVDSTHGLLINEDGIFNKSKSSEKFNQIIDSFGGLPDLYALNQLEPINRKIIEESPDPLLSGSTWRFYDQPEQISRLISWLNPWGIRESQLRKELLNVKDAITSSMVARRKALSLDENSEAMNEILRDIQDVLKKIKSLTEEESKYESEFMDSIVVNPKRTLRSEIDPRKRQKIRSTSDILKFGDLNELNELKEKLRGGLIEQKEKENQSKVLEWVNSRAMEEYDRLLYDGADKYISKAPKRQKR